MTIPHIFTSHTPFSRCDSLLNLPVIICNDEDKSVPEGAKTIRVPKTVDCLQGLINVIPLQLLSYREFRV